MKTLVTFNDLHNYIEGACHFRKENGEIYWDCDHTYVHTKRWCEGHTITFEKQEKEWPRINGQEIPACCDCEVAFNIPDNLLSFQMEATL